jgi:hypothetical protein
MPDFKMPKKKEQNEIIYSDRVIDILEKSNDARRRLAKTEDERAEMEAKTAVLREWRLQAQKNRLRNE